MHSFCRILFLSFVLCATAAPALCDTLPLDWYWSHGLGATHLDSANRVQFDSAGNLYVVGSFQDSLTLSPTVIMRSAANVTTAFVAKYDHAGTLMWARHIDGSGCTAMDVAIDRMGQVYVGGVFNKMLLAGGRDTLRSSEMYGSFVIHYSTDGGYLWSQHVTQVTNFNALAVDDLGNLLVTGDGGTVALSPAAIVQWTAAAGRAIAALRGGGAYVLNGGSLRKFAADGTPVGSLNFPENDEVSLDLVCDDSGNIYLSTDILGTADFGNGVTVTSGGGRCLVKFDVNGVAQWAAKLKGTGWSGRMRIAIEPGSALSPGNVMVAYSKLGRDMFLDEYSASGTLLRTKQLAHSTQTLDVAGFAVSNRGDIGLCGNFSGTLTMGALSLASPGAADGFIGMVTTPPMLSGPFDFQFPRVFCTGGESDSAIVFTNSGRMPLRITQLSRVGDTLSSFILPSRSLPVTLQPDSTLGLDLRYHPHVAGNETATLVVASNSILGATSVIALRGNSERSGYSSSTTSVAFQPVAVNDTAADSLFIRNTGTATAFIVASTTLPFAVGDRLLAIPAGDSAAIAVKFTGSSSPGNITGVLSLSDSVCGVVLFVPLKVSVGASAIRELTQPADHELMLYPQPAENVVTLARAVHAGGTVRIVDALGRTRSTTVLAAGDSSAGVDISSLECGVYFCEVSGGGKISRGMLCVRR